MNRGEPAENFAPMTASAGARVGDPAGTPVDFEVPPGACDCHVHVVGDPLRFPFAQRRVYTPPPASIEQLLEFQRRLRFARVVVVQPSVYGSDNACTLDAVRRIGGRARGIVVIDRSTPRDLLQEMAAAGIRGVRVNLETDTAGFDPAAAKNMIDRTAERIGGLGWHIQIYARTSCGAQKSPRAASSAGGDRPFRPSRSGARHA
jgi:predicted TIM-barrel fold metal-dependent hydrolase